ncbi:MAG TPA: hypothetical protein VFZ46_03280 [Nitrososphaeraceae archaeon]
MPTKLKDIVKNFHKLTNKNNATFLVELLEHLNRLEQKIQISECI